MPLVFDKDCIEPVGFLGDMIILTVWILPAPEYGIFSHLFVLSSVSFISALWFSKYRYITPKKVYT